MTPHELAQKCADALHSAAEFGLPQEQAMVLLVLPKGWKPAPRFPRGKTAQWKPDGSRVVYFNALNVLAWLAAHGLVNVQTAVKGAPDGG